jgi:hypothetical protein
MHKRYHQKERKEKVEHQLLSPILPSIGIAKYLHTHTMHTIQHYIT